MSRLPESWEQVTIGDVLAPLEDGRTIHQGWSPRCEKEPSEDDSVWGVLKTTAIQAGSFQPQHNKRLPEALTPRPMLEVREGDVIVTSAGPRARCGVATLVRETRPRLMLSGKMYRFRFNEKLVLPRFGEAYLLSDVAMRLIDGMKTGISDSGLNLTHERFRKLPFPMPPLPEQQRILAAIEEQFSRLDAAEASVLRGRKQLVVFRASALADSFAGDHPVKALGELADTQLGKMLSQKANKGTGQPYLRNKNVQWDRFDLSDVAKMEFSPAEAEKFLLRPGDVLVCEGGEVGRAAVWHGELEVSLYQKALHRVRSHGELLPEFLMYYMRRLADTNGFARYVTGSTIDHLPQEDLRVIPVPAPSKDVQATIVASIERLMSLAAAMELQLDVALARSTALRGAVLRDAFSGRLAVQDSTIEREGATA